MSRPECFWFCPGGPEKLLEYLLDLFYITVCTDSDIEKKQVEEWKGGLDFLLFNSDSSLPVCPGSPTASFSLSLAP